MLITEVSANTDLFVELKKLGSKEAAFEKIYEMVKQNKLTVDQMDELILRIWKSFTYPGQSE